MKKICILHPEGNINDNPNLFGIVELLCENGYSIDLYCQKKDYICQESQIKNLTIYFDSNIESEIYAKVLIQKYTITYDFIIGIDQQGIIQASRIANSKNIPYCLLSYEIFFSDELYIENKEEEINACKNICFAIVQDEIRGKLLSIENKIPIEKLVYIPVAGREFKNPMKNDYLHKLFCIPESKKIALQIGSIANWSMIDEIVDSTKKWPDNWVLVLHNRYVNESIEKKYKINDKIYISAKPFNSFNELEQIINSADIGLGFYKPTFQNQYDGKNIQYIGLSSGKIATYLQHGLPVIINNIEPLNSLVTKYKIGINIQNINELFNVLQSFNLNLFENKNFQYFFSEYLALNEKFKQVLNKIEYYITYYKNRRITLQNFDGLQQEISLIYSKNQKLNLDYVSLIEKNASLILVIKKIYDSKSFKLGNLILSPFSILKNIIKK